MERLLFFVALSVASTLQPVLSAEKIGATDDAKHVFYVAPDGNDDWTGRRTTVNAEQNDGPFATLTRARDAVRQLKYDNGGQLARPVRVRGGTYRFRDPLRLSGGDSGTKQYPVTYAAFQGEMPVLSGGMLVEDWQPHEGQIVKAHLPDVEAGYLWFRQLFYNGRRLVRARWPQ